MRLPVCTCCDICVCAQFGLVAAPDFGLLTVVVVVVIVVVVGGGGGVVAGGGGGVVVVVMCCCCFVPSFVLFSPHLLIRSFLFRFCA